MREWYQGLSRRDQLLLIAMLFALMLLLSYSWIWVPVSEAKRRYEVSNSASLESLVWMREATEQIVAARGRSSVAGYKGKLSALVDETLPAFDLVMKRYQPTSDGGAQVWLEDAPLHQVIAWVSELEVVRGMRVERLSVVGSGQQGKVKTQVRLSAQ